MRRSVTGPLLCLASALLLPALRVEAGPPPLPAPFVRGDSNLDGVVNISDPSRTLGILFLGEAPNGCSDAMDANDDGATDIADASYTLNFLFRGGPGPSAPFPECGADPSEDALSCEMSPAVKACAPPLECFDAEDINDLIETNLPPEICIAPDATMLEALGFTITVCSAAQAPENCAGLGPGCPASVTSVETDLDVAGATAGAHIEGEIVDMPVEVSNVLSTVICSATIEFSGDVDIAFELNELEPGVYEVTDVLALETSNIEFTLSATGGTVCTLLANSASLFEDQIVQQIEAVTGDLIIDIARQVVGTIVCE